MATIQKGSLLAQAASFSAPCCSAALRGTAQRNQGYRQPVGFASPLSRLRFTHGYALAAATRLTFLNSYNV
ncbi:MAG: hypothetical protein IKP00_17155 [Victivallales bacterium]|nr:hypothetical protein [Victivallales bacterium]